jgi:DNA primase
MADQLEEIKRKIDIVELINEFVPLKKTGRNFKALCPFHSETAPSFIVSPERQIFKCFGCGESGDIFGFLMKTEGLEFGEALRLLAKRAGVKLQRYQPSEAEKQKSLLYEINHLASEFYHYLLTAHRVGKQALQYLQVKRGINQETLRLFKLGFAPAMWDGLQQFLVNKKGYQVEALEKAGLVIKSEKGRGYYDRFRARLMFPLEDHRGNIAGFAGRTLDPKQTEAKYVNTPETPAYHKSDLLYGLSQNREAIKKAKAVIVVEGELDALSSYQVGVKNVVAIKGSALTVNQASLLKRFTDNLILALYRDVAGDQAARRGIETADQAGFSIHVVKLQGGKDPDEVAQKDARLWQKLVKEAMPVYDYFLDSAFSRFDIKTADGKRAIGRELVPVLGKISDEIVRSHYTSLLAEKLAVNEEAIMAQIDKFLAQEKAPVTWEKPGEPSEKPGRQEILEEHLLALAFQSQSWPFLRQKRVLVLFKTSRFQRLLEVLGQYLKKYKSLESDRLAKMLPAELVPVFNKLFLLDLGSLMEKEELVAKELEKTLSELEKLGLHEALKALSDQIRSLEKEKKPEGETKAKLKKLNEEFRDLSAKLTELEPKK